MNHSTKAKKKEIDKNEQFIPLSIVLSRRRVVTLWQVSRDDENEKKNDDDGEIGEKKKFSHYWLDALDFLT